MLLHSFLQPKSFRHQKSNQHREFLEGNGIKRVGSVCVWSVLDRLRPRWSGRSDLLAKATILPQQNGFQ